MLKRSLVAKTIHAFGDSFTTVLNKPLRSERCYVKSYIDWIADYNNCRLVNHAKDGNCNPSIAYDVMSRRYLTTDKVVICWSGLLRPWTWDNGFVSPPGNAKSDPEEALFMSEICMRACEDYLTKQGVDYIMTAAFVTPYYVRRENWNWIENRSKGNTLLDICNGSWLVGDYKDPDFNHVDTEQNENLEFCLHPNERGHKLIADTLNKYIME